jgi:hypothetical protein
MNQGDGKVGDAKGTQRGRKKEVSGFGSKHEKIHPNSFRQRRFWQTGRLFLVSAMVLASGEQERERFT